MEKQVPEHLNMDSAAGNMPPQPTPERLKKKLPKGELNPYIKHTAAPHKSEEIQRKHATGPEMEEEQLKGNWSKAINMFSPGQEKQAIIADKALQEVTKVSEEELQKRDKQIFQTWIQQNPVQAALLGIDPDDPFEEKKGKSPAKYYKDSPLKAIYGAESNPGVRHMSRQDAFNYGQQINQNRMSQAGIAGGQLLQEKLTQWDQERQQYKEKLKAQKDREAKEIIEASKPLVQAMDNSAALDESSKNLLAQQWKQKFVENEKKYKNGEIDQYEYGLNKQQSLSNAEQYANAVNNLTQGAQQYAQMIKDGTASDAMSEDARDFYTSMAAGKGLNIQVSKDPKTGEERRVMAPGMSIQNDPNGNPTLMGYTAGQEESARKLYQTLTQEVDPVTGMPKVDAKQVPFETWISEIIPRQGDPKLQEFIQQKQQENQQRQAQGLAPLDYESWINGVNIPVANLASGEGMPEILAKDNEFDANITSFANDIAQKAINSYAYPAPTSTEGLWDGAADYSKEYISQMMNQMPEQTVRTIAADYLDMTPSDIRKVLDAEGGLEALKKQMEPEMLEAVKLKFEADPSIAAINKEWRDRTNAMAKQANAANLRGTSSAASAKQEAIDAQATQIANSNDLSTFTGMKFGNDLYEEIKKVDDHRSLWEKVAPTSMGGQEAPTEQMYEVRLKDGKRVPMTESQLRQKLFTSLGVRAGESAPQASPEISAQADEIMAELGFGGSPTPYRSGSPLKALPIASETSYKGLKESLRQKFKKQGYSDEQIKNWMDQNRFDSYDSFQLGYSPYEGGVDSRDFGVSDREHMAGMSLALGDTGRKMVDKFDFNSMVKEGRDAAGEYVPMDQRLDSEGKLKPGMRGAGEYSRNPNALNYKENYGSKHWTTDEVIAREEAKLKKAFEDQGLADEYAAAKQPRKQQRGGGQIDRQANIDKLQGMIDELEAESDDYRRKRDSQRSGSNSYSTRSSRNTPSYSNQGFQTFEASSGSTNPSYSGGSSYGGGSASQSSYTTPSYGSKKEPKRDTYGNVDIGGSYQEQYNRSVRRANRGSTDDYNQSLRQASGQGFTQDYATEHAINRKRANGQKLTRREIEYLEWKAKNQ